MCKTLFRLTGRVHLLIQLSMNHFPRWTAPQGNAEQHVPGLHQETGQPWLHSFHHFICKNIKNRRRHGVLLFPHLSSLSKQRPGAACKPPHKLECSRQLRRGGKRLWVGRRVLSGGRPLKVLTKEHACGRTGRKPSAPHSIAGRRACALGGGPTNKPPPSPEVRHSPPMHLILLHPPYVCTCVYFITPHFRFSFFFFSHFPPRI